MAGEKGVLICGEMGEGGATAPITFELLGVARKLANDLGDDLSALIMGNGVDDDVARGLIARGADKVYVVNHPLLAQYHPDCYATVTEKVCRQLAPNIFLMGRTEIGQDVAPVVAWRLDTGLAMDCLELSIDPESKLLVMARPVYGGNARAVFLCEKTRPQMATIRPKTQDPLEPDASRQGEIVHLEAGIDASVMRTRFVEHIPWETEGVSLEAAEIIVSGGRGIGSPEAYKETIEVAAAVLRGAPGASKAACDAGYAPPGNQVGLTGKRVSPKLYVAVAISGASQHLAGMGTSKNVVAINKDPDANIFKVSRFGVVADYKQVMPAFVKKCRELVAG